MKTFLYGLLLLLAGCAFGFFTGRRSAPQPAAVEYRHEPALTGAVEPLRPVKVELPVIPLLPVRTDTVYIDRVMHISRQVDTAAIIADYELRRSYVAPLFDSQYGKLTLSLSTQYNRLDALSYEFVPVTKTVYLEKTWQPFALTQYSALGGIALGAGAFYRKTAYYIMYSTDFRRHGLGAGVMVRF
jgi:hypothetical protein